MAKYDEQLNRMSYLMEYSNTPKRVASNIEFSTTGADGKVYGILKEGTKYYIKTTEQGKETLSESYEYINGYNYRRENEYSSYNEASKQLELKLMSLNEAYDKKTPVSTVDFKRNEKAFVNLTNEARAELDRMNAIFENSCKIGKADCICDPESKGAAKPEDTEENNDPFSKLVDFKNKNGELEVKAPTDGDEMKEVKNVDADLTSDKNKTENTTTKDDYKAAHPDLEGDGVADKTPSGAKAVVVNEGIDDEDLVGIDDENNDEVLSTELGVEDFETPEENEIEPVENPTDDVNDLVDQFEGNAEEEEDEEDLDTLLEEFEAAVQKDAEHVTVENDEPEENLKSFDAKGTLPVQSVEKLSDKIDKITDLVYENIVSNNEWGKHPKFRKEPMTTPEAGDKKAYGTEVGDGKPFEKKEKEYALRNKIEELVNEELRTLGIWGAHPKFREEPMTTPSTEVHTDDAVKDVDSDSVKGKKPYGTKVGDGSPFTEKVVNILTDQVLATIKEQLSK